MLYVFFGNDTARVRENAFSFVETLDDGNCEVIKVSPDAFVSGLIVDQAQGVGLFGTTQVIVLDTPSDDTQTETEVYSHLEIMQQSRNHFVLIEGKRTAAQKKQFEKYAAKSEELQGEKIERFNAFSLTDAFLRRDKKSLWLLLVDAWSAGLPNEEIIGVLFWQIKILRLVERTKSAEEAGQKPFVYQKANQALRYFKKGELDRLSGSLLSIYHDGHLGKRDMSMALEEWVLKI